jgi:hypothetical protein
MTDVVFGDIDLEAHRAWEEEQCAAEGLRARLPLWKIGREEAVREFLGLGYRARVVCVNARWLDQSFAGREFDSAFVADLPPDVDHCGENGEFHTFVFAGPRFRPPVEHRVADVVRHEARHPLGDGPTTSPSSSSESPGAIECYRAISSAIDRRESTGRGGGKAKNPSFSSPSHPCEDARSSFSRHAINDYGDDPAR